MVFIHLYGSLFVIDVCARRLVFSIISYRNLTSNSPPPKNTPNEAKLLFYLLNHEHQISYQYLEVKVQVA